MDGWDECETSKNTFLILKQKKICYIPSPSPSKRGGKVINGFWWIAIIFKSWTFIGKHLCNYELSKNGGWFMHFGCVSVSFHSELPGIRHLVLRCWIKVRHFISLPRLFLHELVVVEPRKKNAKSFRRSRKCCQVKHWFMRMVSNCQAHPRPCSAHRVKNSCVCIEHWLIWLRVAWRAVCQYMHMSITFLGAYFKYIWSVCCASLCSISEWRFDRRKNDTEMNFCVFSEFMCLPKPNALSRSSPLSLSLSHCHAHHGFHLALVPKKKRHHQFYVHQFFLPQYFFTAAFTVCVAVNVACYPSPPPTIAAMFKY